MYARKIKELSIALEALSRINGADAYFQQICSLLQNAIDAQYKEDHPPKPAPTKILADDEIPF